MMSDCICALTSLSPAPQHLATQRAALRTWADAGLQVQSFNHPSEIEALGSLYDVTFVPVARTSAEWFGRHLIPITCFMEWAAAYGGPVMIINSDIELQLAPWELRRARWASDGGLCCFVRYNHNGEPQHATREAYGFDAFLFSGGDGALFAESFLSMGQPFWDYWVPHAFAMAGRRLTFVEFPAAFHRGHPGRWSWASWHRCALEFARVTGTSCPGETLEACHLMSNRVRQSFDRDRVSLPQRPMTIRDWVTATFADARARTLLELGAHCGTDTFWLSQIPGATIHAFEPDPRNEPPPLGNVTVHRAAISAVDGRAAFVLSDRGWGRPWTYSSSLKRPKHHLERYPVTFAETIEVETVTLDSFARRSGVGPVEFIWADIQGAEGDMIRGGRETLGRTHYLYTEYSDDELYEGQVTLSEMLAMLPDFRVVELWPEDVLLENRAFRSM
jgi:FkbM family methyltransferase